MKEAVELELGLEELQFVVIEHDQTKLGVMIDAGVVKVALAKVKADYEVQGVDCEDNIGW